jgi:hypothetical protein
MLGRWISVRLSWEDRVHGITSRLGAVASLRRCTGILVCACSFGRGDAVFENDQTKPTGLHSLIQSNGSETHITVCPTTPSLSSPSSQALNSLL